MELSSKKYNYDELVNLLIKQEERIAKIESLLRINSSNELVEDDIPNLFRKKDSESNDSLEYTIGQFWFAKLGILVLMTGVIFLLTFPYKNLPSFLPSVLGYVLTILLMFVAKEFSSKFSYISGYLKGGAIALLYFSTMRFHYFTTHPAINSLFLETILLLCITVLTLFISLKSKSAYLVGLSIATGYVTLLLNGNTFFIFSSLALLSAFFTYLKLKYSWEGVLTFGIVLTYTAHFLWFINNPLLGNVLKFNYEPRVNSVFVLLYMVIFAFSSILKSGNLKEKFYEVFNTGLNIFLSYVLFLIITFGNTDYILTLLHIFASLIFLTLAFVFWSKFESKLSTFLFAISAYLALSTAIINQFPIPDFFILLCWQSLLVVSTALWFRSKFIIIANFFMYLLVFILYVVLNGKLNSVSISYGIVALLSARILNWKKERLELKTDLMRNAYLILGLLIIPYALYHTLPEVWVSVSWIFVALLYYLLSVVLKSKKYRWMALATLLLTIGYIFVFGISRLEPTYKIISFLVLGIVLLVVSLMYAKSKGKYFNKSET